MKLEHLDKVDRILLSAKDSKQLDDWWLNIHDGAFNEFRPVLEEGIIVQELDPNLKYDEAFIRTHDLNASLFLIYFKQLDEMRVYYEIYQKIHNDRIVYILKGIKNYAKLKSDLTINKDNHIGLKLEHAIQFLDSITSSHVALMNYMELYKEERERVSFQSVRKAVTKKTKNGKKKKNTRPIKMVIYDIKVPQESITEEERKAYKRMKEAWMVRGHWRILPSGEKTWIKPHVKGDKEKLEPNVYYF